MKVVKKEKNIIVDVLFSIVVIIVVVVLGYKFLNSEFFRFNVIKYQFKNAYGVSLVEGKVFKEKFWANTEDGVQFKGTCDFFGNIKSESYVHFYYADEAMELFSEKIKPYFDDCIIITQDKFLGLYQVEYDFKSINSFDEYQDALEKGYPSMFVLLRESEDIEHVRAAIEMLKESEIESDVLFQMIPDDMYEAHIDNGIYCYFDSMSDYMDDFRNLLEDSKENYGRFDELVFGKKYRCGIICEFFTEILVDGEWIRI